MKANTSSKANLKMTGAVTKPTVIDILMGRGGMSNNHPGNKHYHSVLETRAWEYSQLKGRNAKTDLAWEVFHQLKREGARFLKYDKPAGVYFEAPNDEARKKISQRLRELALEVREHSTSEEDEYEAEAETEALDMPLPLKDDGLKRENPFETDKALSDFLQSCLLDDDTNKKPSPSSHHTDTLLTSSLHTYEHDSSPSSNDETNSDLAVCGSLGDLSACELSALATAPLPLTFEFSFDWPEGFEFDGHDLYAAEAASNRQPLGFAEDLRFGAAERVASFPSIDPASGFDRVTKGRRQSH